MSEGSKPGGSRIANQLAHQKVGHDIPEVAPIARKLSLRHYVLTMTRGRDETLKERGLPPRSLVFFKVERTPRPRPVAADEAAAHEIAKAIVAKNITQYPFKKASSFDFEKDIIPGWVLIELDPTINWQFPIDHPGVTTKTPDRSAEQRGAAPLNANLRYVHLENGEPVVSTQAPESGCRFILFAALDREMHDAERMKGQKFNFIVEFYQRMKSGDALQTIPLIIDPDFPSDGPGGG